MIVGDGSALGGLVGIQGAGGPVIRAGPRMEFGQGRGVNNCDFVANGWIPMTLGSQSNVSDLLDRFRIKLQRFRRVFLVIQTIKKRGGPFFYELATVSSSSFKSDGSGYYSSRSNGNRDAELPKL